MKKRTGLVSGTSTTARTAARPDRESATTPSKEVDTLKSKIKELEGRVESLQQAQSAADAPVTTNGEEKTGDSEEVKALKSKIEDLEEMVSWVIFKHRLQPLIPPLDDRASGRSSVIPG